jgi:hypothetical protein
VPKLSLFFFRFAMEAVMVPSGETALSKSDEDGSAQVHSNGDANGAGSDGDSPPPAKKSKISASDDVGKKAPIVVELGSDALPEDNGDTNMESEEEEDEEGGEENGGGEEHQNGEGSDGGSVCEVAPDEEEEEVEDEQGEYNGDEDQGEGQGEQGEEDEIQEVDYSNNAEEEDDDEIQEVDEDGEPLDNGGNSMDASNGAPSEKESPAVTITPEKKATNASRKADLSLTPRRSGRNVNKQKKYSDGGEEEASEESDIEEIVPQDPLAVSTPNKTKTINVDPLSSMAEKIPKKNTIIVSDTKSLAKIAASSKDGKKEPTLVIIDTNSILSGKGPVPLTAAAIAAAAAAQSSSNLPAALPAQGLYPVQKSKPATPPPSASGKQQKQPAGLTDDMYVVEAPSFIVPYVYEKPAKEPLKETVEMLAEVVKESERKEREEHKKKKVEEKEKRAKRAELKAKKKVTKQLKFLECSFHYSNISLPSVSLLENTCD